MNSNLPEQPVVTIELGEQHITLLGTAHVSKVSAEAVKSMLGGGQYDAVAVELCPSRHNAMVRPDSIARMDLFQVIRERKVAMVAASLALGAFQQRIADQFGVKPGAEMLEAVEFAQSEKIPIFLVDREVGITLKRIYHNIPWWQRLSLMSGLFASMVSREKVSEEDIERLKEGDLLESTFSQFAEQSQSLFLPLIDERDRYMAARLLQEVEKQSFRKILVVVGAGHLRGIEKYLSQAKQDGSKKEEPQQVIDALDVVPRSRGWLKIVPWIIVALVLLGFALGFSHSSELGWSLVVGWVLINGGLSALGAAIAGAHPLTILGAFIAAPLTSLNPMVGAGMVTAMIEIYMRKPKVADFNRLKHDTTHLKGWWKNRVTRTFLVFILSTLGSAIGTYVAGFYIFEQLSS